VAAQDLRDVTGLHEASFGEESSEKSGIALARKQNQAQIVTYNFPDNVAKGVKRTGEILLDLIPEIYDAEREMRIIGADGAEDYETVNQLVQATDDQGMPTTVRVNDMSAGKYDVTVSTGPNFSTMRQEAAEVYGELGAKNPALMQVAGDLIFKSLDYPYAEEIAKRWETILPPPIQKMLTEGKELPPEAMAAMAQAEQAMAMVQQQTQLVQQAAQEVQQDQAKSVQAKANVEKVIADLKVQRAQFDAEVTKKLAELSIKEAAINQQAVTRDMDLAKREMSVQGDEQRVGDAKKQSVDLEQFKEQLDEMTARFMEHAAQTIGTIEGEVKKPKRKLKSAKTKRDGANLFADVEFDDGTRERFQASRQNGELVAVPVQAAPTGAIQ
jgi:hypothetical protein